MACTLSFMENGKRIYVAKHYHEIEDYINDPTQLFTLEEKDAYDFREPFSAEWAADFYTYKVTNQQENEWDIITHEKYIADVDRVEHPEVIA